MKHVVICIAAAAILTSAAKAQFQTKPGPEHARLASRAGTWNIEGEEEGVNEKPQGFSLSLQIKGATLAERFGMLVDRFGIPWTINCEATDQAVGA